MTVAVIGGIAWFIYTQARPKGDRVGELDLMHPQPFLFEVTAGTTLLFRMDYTVETTRIKNTAVPDEDKVVDGALTASTLHVTLEEANGTQSRVRCATYDGTSLKRSQGGFEHTREGVPVTCRLDVSTSGRAKLEAEVAWDSAIKPRSATLEVRSERRAQ